MSLARFPLEAYQANGFAAPITLMPSEEMAGYRAALETAEAAHGPLHYKHKPYLLHRPTADLVRHPALLDAVEAVLGPDILVYGGSYVIKEPESGGFVSWHQDLTYWGLSSDRQVTVWIALSDAQPDNGCMRMIRGSHQRGRLDHADTRSEDNILHRGQTVDVSAFAEEDIVDVPLEPGQASLHHGWVLHASNPNASRRRRVGLAMQYIAPSVKQVVGASDTATLLRGEDRYGHFAPEPWPAADFDPALVAYQAEIERRKHAVYDTAP